MLLMVVSSSTILIAEVCSTESCGPRTRYSLKLMLEAQRHLFNMYSLCFSFPSPSLRVRSHHSPQEKTKNHRLINLSIFLKCIFFVSSESLSTPLSLGSSMVKIGLPQRQLFLSSLLCIAFLRTVNILFLPAFITAPQYSFPTTQFLCWLIGDILMVLMRLSISPYLPISTDEGEDNREFFRQNGHSRSLKR